MLALVYVLVMIVFGDHLCRLFYRFISLPHRIAASFLVGLLLSSWITYLGALLFAQTAASPLLWGNLSFFLVASGVVFLLRRYQSAAAVAATADIAPPGVRSAESEKWDWAIISVYFVFVCWLMFSTLGSSENKLRVTSRHWSDFGPNTAVMQGFVFGRNFPPENPHYAGELMRHHFLFWFQAGNLEYLGLNPAWSINLLSVLTMVAMLVLIIVLGEVLFDSRIVGYIASALFFFSGSLAYIPFLRAQSSLAEIAHSVFNSQQFLRSGFPYLGEAWGLWTVDVFLQQRHFASGISILLLVLIFLINRHRRQLLAVRDQPSAPAEERTVAPESFRRVVPGFIFSGVLIGMLPLWNSAVFLAAFAVLACWLLLFPDRRYLLCLAGATAVVCLPQLLYLRSGQAGVPGYPKFHWGYVVSDPTVARVLKFLGFSIGLKWLLIAAALILVSRFHRRFFIAASSLLFVAFFVQFNPDILANHKFINIWLILANLFVAYSLLRLWQATVIKQAMIARIVAIVLVIGIVLGGIIDFFPIRNERGYGEVPFKDDPLITWLRSETKPSDIFLTHRYVSHQILLAGRRIFYGWPYYAWSAGLPTRERDKIYRRMFEEREPEKLIRLLNENRITYVVIDDGLRLQNNLVKNLNEATYGKYFKQVYGDPEKRFGALAIYRVPTYEEWRKELTPEQTSTLAAAAATPPPDANVFKGGKGVQQGEFAFPHGIAVDKAGNIFVADTSNGRIQKFSPEGTYLATFGEGISKSPNGIAVDDAGNIYVSDGATNHVQKFKADDFSLLLQWPGPDQGFYGPSDIALGADGSVYVVDQGWARIVKFTADGQLLGAWGGKGTGDGELNEPTGIAVNEQHVYVADMRNARIQVFDSNGKFLNKWLVPEWTFQQAGWRAPDIVYDKQSKRLYASSTNTNEVLVFETGGKQLGKLAPAPPDGLKGPTTLTIGKGGQLYVLNTLSSHVSAINVGKK